MRSISQLKLEIERATDYYDASALLQLADELLLHGTSEARAIAAKARGWAGICVADNAGAVKHFEEAVMLCRELGDSASEAQALGNIGVAHYEMGNYKDALEMYGKAKDVYTEIGNAAGVGRVEGNIGAVYSSIGNYEKAFEGFYRAIAAYEIEGDKSSIANYKEKIGLTHGQLGDYPSALEQFTEAESLYQSIEHRSGIASATGNIGLVYHSSGDYPSAMEYFHRALVLHEELEDRNGVAVNAASIGLVHQDNGEFAEALERLTFAFIVFTEQGKREQIAITTNNIGVLHYKMKDYPAAMEYYRNAQQLQEELGSGDLVINTRVNIMLIHIETNEISEAKTILNELDEVVFNNPEVFVRREMGRASIQEVDLDLSGAANTLKAALDITIKHSLRLQESEVYLLLRNLCQKSNDFAGFITYNDSFTKLNEEIRGKNATLKIAMHQKTRELESREREHQKHMAVLHSTLPKHIADRVAGGEVVTDHFVNAAVLFLDVVGFTSNSALLPPGEVVDSLQSIFTTFDSICAKHNVTKIKTIGDSYMAVAFPSAAASPADSPRQLSPGNILPDNFSRTISPGDNSHHFNLANAAIEMINAQFTWSHNSTPVEFRIGLHCGPVVAGVLGKERMQYDVWGDTVNVASRMESNSEAGRVHVSEAFAKALRSGGITSDTTSDPMSDTVVDNVKIWRRGEIEVKGKGVMKTYWLEESN